MLFSGRTMSYLANPQGRTAQTFLGTTSLAVDQKKFGTYSLDVPDAVNARFTTVGHNDTNFTLEAWVRFSKFNSSGYVTIWDHYGGTSALGIYSNNIVTYQSSSGNIDFNLGVTLGTGLFHHIALTRSGDTIKLFINGTQRGGDQTLGGSFLPSGAQLRLRGSNLGNTYASHMDEVRLSKTVRYTGSFSVPTAPFTNDANTVLLCHFEQSPLVDDNS